MATRIDEDLAPPKKRGRKPTTTTKAEATNSVAAMETQTEPPAPRPPYEPLANSNIFWKLACPKTALNLLMCSQCRDANIRSGNKKFNAVAGERLEVTFSFCADCAQANFDCTDAYMRLNARKRGEDPYAYKNKKEEEQ